MAVIGVFTPTKDGGWVGSIRTLLIDIRVRLVPNDNRDNDAAPAFRIFAGRSEVGAAWSRRSAADPPREYLSVQLFDPALPESIAAAMFASADETASELVWTRK